MSDLFWLTDAQMARLAPFFPKPHGKPRVDDRRVLSGIIFINRNGLRWRDAPKEYGPHKTLYSRWKRWSEKGIFARMMTGLAAEHGEEKTVMIDATYLKAHRTATSMAAKKGGAVVLSVEPKAARTPSCTPSATVRDDRSTCSSPPDRSAITSAHAHCSAAYQTSNGCSGIVAMTQIGPEKRCRTKGYAPVSQAERNARSRSSTTDADTSGAIASRSCSEDSRIGGVWPPDMTGARRSSFRPSPSPPSLYTGYES